MPKQPSRPVASKEEPDLRPPEEIRAGRIRRFVFLGAITAAVLGVGIYFAARPIGGAIKGWQSRRLAREAFALIDQKKWIEAAATARDAYALQFTEPESWRAVARVASRTDQWAAALEWWKKIDDANRLTAEDRRDFIAAAVVSGEIAVAAKQVEALLAQPGGPMPIDIVWAGQVAARQSNPELAFDYAQRALADKRAKPYDILSAATLILSNTRPDSEPYAIAWHRIENAARDPKNPGSLQALVLLTREKALPPMTRIDATASLSLETPPTPPPTPAMQGAASVEATAAKATGSPGASAAADEGGSPAPEASLGSTSQPTFPMQSSDTLILNLTATPPAAPAGRTMSLTEVANALENHPDARPSHKLLALEVRARQDPALTDQDVADAVERFGNAARLAQSYEGGPDLADETLLALATWLNKIGRPAKTLEVLPEAHAIQRQDFLTQYANALAALQRWTDVKDLFLSEHSVVDPTVQHMYLAVAQAHLGSATGATNEWQRALQVANTPEKLLMLATNAEQNSAPDIADAAYSEVIKTAPTNRAAYAGRLRLALAAGKTAQAQPIASQIAQLWPDDAAARNQDAYLRLLLGASGERQTQQSAKLKCLPEWSRGTGKPGRHSGWRGFAWDGMRTRSQHSAV